MRAIPYIFVISLLLALYLCAYDNIFQIKQRDTGEEMHIGMVDKQAEDAMFKNDDWYSLEEIFHDASSYKHSNSVSSGITSEINCWKYFEKKLTKNAFTQFEKLIKEENFSVKNIDHLIKISENDYVLAIAFPNIAKGLYNIKLPEDLTQEPTISEKLSFAHEIIKVISNGKSGIWLFVTGSSMNRGFGYEEFSLVNPEYPDKKLILASIDFLSEERGSESIKEEVWENIESEIKEKFEEIGDFVGYKILGNCVEVTSLTMNLKSKKEILVTHHACIEGNSFRIWKTTLLEKNNNTKSFDKKPQEIGREGE